MSRQKLSFKRLLKQVFSVSSWPSVIIKRARTSSSNRLSNSVSTSQMEARWIRRVGRPSVSRFCEGSYYSECRGDAEQRDRRAAATSMGHQVTDDFTPRQLIGLLSPRVTQVGNSFR